MSADVAFENLLTAILVSLKQAKEGGDEAASMAYFDMLDVGLQEAKRAGIHFEDSELRNLDPYSLLGDLSRKKAAA
ncbi:MAG: hypothetical protein AB7S42_12215 [Lysobacteraceae bacterium]